MRGDANTLQVRGELMSRPLAGLVFVFIKDDVDGAAWLIGKLHPNGRLIYYLSNRDGFGCLYAQRIDPDTGKLADAPLEVKHFRGSEHSLDASRSGGAWNSATVTRSCSIFADVRYGCMAARALIADVQNTISKPSCILPVRASLLRLQWRIGVVHKGIGIHPPWLSYEKLGFRLDVDYAPQRDTLHVNGILISVNPRAVSRVRTAALQRCIACNSRSAAKRRVRFVLIRMFSLGYRPCRRRSDCVQEGVCRTDCITRTEPHHDDC